MEITITKTTAPKEMVAEDKLGFGHYFSDHMFIMDYDRGIGWHDARIVPFGYISLHPASTVLHYGAEIFEGLKAYRRADGGVQLFRPMENIKRMNRSAERMCLPLMDEDMMLEILTTFVRTEERWVPHSFGTSLYLRPFLFGNDETLGVHTVSHATFMLIASPSGSYYAEGINPVKIMIESEDVRAVRGGTGFAKCGGNYAASTRAGEIPPAELNDVVRNADLPLMITEFYTKAIDSGLANTRGAGWTVATQQDRADFFQTYTLRLLECKNFIGWHWFQYIDNDPHPEVIFKEDGKTWRDQSSIDANKGIVDNYHRPYETLRDAMAEINKNVYRLIDHFDAKYAK